VTKAKKNTVLYCKYFDPISRKEKYKKINPKGLLRTVYKQLSTLSKGGVISISDIYIKLSYETTNRKGKPVRRWRYVPIQVKVAIQILHYSSPLRFFGWPVAARKGCRDYCPRAHPGFFW